MLLIDAIAIVETGNRNIPGDHGAALSPFQIHRGAWEDVKKRFGDPTKEIYLNVGERFEDIANTNDVRMFARNCATGYVFIIQDRLQRARVLATPENIYACWNLGFEGFKAHKFNLKLCSFSLFCNAREVGELYRSKDPPPVHHGHD